MTTTRQHDATPATPPVGRQETVTRRRERIETFELDHGSLVRKVVPVRGQRYEHRCPLAAYEELAHAAEELGDALSACHAQAGGFTLGELGDHAAVPWTQAAVALAFWKERGCVETRYRRSYPASTFLFEDTMIEYHALALDTAGRAKLGDRGAIRAAERPPPSQGLTENG